MLELKQNLHSEYLRIRDFILETVRAAGFERVILGLSGGIDSALVATLCQSILGEDAVYGVMMPYKTSHPDSLKHARLLADALKIKYEIIDISPMVDAFSVTDKFRLGNLMARVRMCVLYDLSAKYQALVVGTCNKSELWTGYCTQYGDSACAFEPIAHLYKTQVWEMSKMLNVPVEIIEKAPTADLWENQTDEGEMGISYKLLDKILALLIDERLDYDKIIAQGIAKADLDLVLKKIENSAFKRRLPLTIQNVWEA